jgi:EmrB/QacA subfamily drug resistance transporter
MLKTSNATIGPSRPPRRAEATASRAARVGAFALTCVPAFMIGLDNLVVVTALATIRSDLGASVEQLSWVVNAYVLSFGVLMLTGALLGDRLGRRRMFVVGLVVFSAASAAAALTPSAGGLIAARAVQGAGAALIAPLGLALLAATFPPNRRGAAIGALSAIIGTAVALGPLVGGAIIDGLAWQWVFWINVPIGLLAAALSPRMLREAFGAARPPDLAGLALASAGLLGIVWAVVRGNDAGWAAAETLGPGLLGLLLLAGFARWQRTAAAPMLPPALFASRSFKAANAASFLMLAGLFCAAFVVPQYLQTVLGRSALEAGLQMLPWTAVTIVITPLAGSLADRVGNRLLIVAGLLLQAAGLAWFALAAAPDSDNAGLVGPLLTAGVGLSVVFPTVANAVVGGQASAELGLASAVNNAFREVGGVVGVAIAAAAFSAAGSVRSAAAFTDGTIAALAAAATLSALGVLAALGVSRARAEATPTPGAARHPQAISTMPPARPRRPEVS